MDGSSPIVILGLSGVEFFRCVLDHGSSPIVILGLCPALNFLSVCLSCVEFYSACVYFLNLHSPCENKLFLCGVEKWLL